MPEPDIKNDDVSNDNNCSIELDGLLPVPDIKENDVSIDEKYRQGFDEALCVEAIWLAHNFIKDNHDDINRGLYGIAALSEFADGGSSTLVVDFQRKDPKIRAGMPSISGLFSFESLGFAITDIEAADAGKPKSKWKQRDLLRFRFSYPQNSLLLLGLKLFAGACGRFRGFPFRSGDIRIMFKGAPKTYSPPIGEIFMVLPGEQRQAAFAIHNKLTELGCVYSLQDSVTTAVYSHPKAKNKPFATIYTCIGGNMRTAGEPEFKIKLNLGLKLNLRNIGKYAGCLSECCESVRNNIIHAIDCAGCNKACGGVQFTYDNRRYAKCPFWLFRFRDFCERAITDYFRLMELEDNEL